MRSRIYLILGILLLSVGVIIAVETSSPSEISINLFNFIYNNYDGATTNFNLLNETEVRNASNVILEVLAYGKIEFLENLNLYDMKDLTWTVNFDSNVNITSNLINVDDYKLPGINKSANLTFYGISFIEPIIYNKGVVCLSCENLSYIGGVFKFNTTLFEGPYYLREGLASPVCGDNVCEAPEDSVSCPSDCTSPPSSGGGGGGGGGDTPTDGEVPAEGLYDFTIFPTLIEASVRKGSYFQKKVTVENTGTRELVIAIVVDRLKDYIFPEVKSFTISPGEIREIRFDIYVSDSVAADAYLGKINFVSKYISKATDFVLLVNNKDALFDIRTTVLKKYVNPGGRARANISLINMGDLRNFDVNLEYKILDFERNEYTIKEEQFAINLTHNNIYFLDTPKDMPIGNYIFYSTVRYKDINATSYDVFTIEKISYISWLILIIIILILMYITIKWYKDRRRELLEKTKQNILSNEGKKKTEVKEIPVEEEIELLP